MARSFDQIEQDYNDKKTDLDRFNIRPNADGSYTLDGEKVTATVFRNLKSIRQSRFNAIKKEYDKARRAGGRSSTQRRKESVLGLTNTAKGLERENSQLAGFIASNKIKLGFDSIADMQAKIETNNARIAEINRQLSTTPADTEAPPTQSPLKGPLQGPFLAGAGEQGLRATVAGGGPVPASTTIRTTGAGGGGVATGKPKRVRTPKLPSNWEAKFREMFPAQSWLLDIDTAKYPQLRKTIEQAIINKAWETPEAAARFSAELDNTDFFKELASDQTVNTIKSLVGDLGFESTPFNKFLTNAMNFGWKGDTLKSEVYKEAFRKDVNGAYVNPTALARAKKSTDWLETARIGKAFFSNLGDSVIEQRLTGVLTEEDIIRQQRELAKTRYGHLSNLIDQGLSLEAISETYRQRAAAVLERDVNDIDMGTTDFEVAFNYGEEGKKRMMSSGEWEIMLRSDAKYGWDKTENAKQEARGLASSIAQAFGRII